MDLTLKTLLAMTVADIDIFLLKNKDQIEDNNKQSFTKEDIRLQLHKTLKKVVVTLSDLGFDVNEPIPKN